MAWNTSYLAELDAVSTVYAGDLSGPELREAVEATLALAQRHGTTSILADCCDLKDGHSIVDLFELAKLLDSAGIAKGAREAVVLPQLGAPASDVRFWETMCRNRGFHVRVFTSVGEARAWLAPETPGRAGS